MGDTDSDQGGSAPLVPLSVPPRLRRAVARCTQHVSDGGCRDSRRVVEEYASNPSTVDAVYSEVLERAGMHPASHAVLLACLRLLKSILARHAPSSSVLQTLASFTTNLQHQLLVGDVSLGVDGATSLEYLCGLVASLQGTGTVEAVTGKSAEAPSPGFPGMERNSGPNGTPAVTESSQVASSTRVCDALRFAQTNQMNEAAGLASLHEVWWGLARIPEAAASLAPMMMEAAPGSYKPPNELDEFQEQEQCVAVADIRETQQHIRTVSSAQQVQAAHGRHEDAERALRPSSMLFQYRPYIHQAPLRLSEGDVAAVVEGIKTCAPPLPREAPFSKSPAAGNILWGRSIGRGSMANICGSLLMKVVIDLWLNVGPVKSFPIVLEMLMELMATGVPELQERAFDVVYNLSLHIQLCGDVAGPMTGGAAPDDGQPLKDMEPWLRQLLFAMLPALHSTDVQAEERVWAAAVSTLAHLAAKSGSWNAEYLKGLSLAVAQRLVMAAEWHCWSPELYSQLVRLTTTIESIGREPPGLHHGALSEANGRSLEVLSPYCWFVSGGKKAAMAAYMAAPTPEARRSFLKMLLRDGEEDKPEGLEQLVDRLSLVQVLQPLFLPQEVGVADRLMDWIKDLLEKTTDPHRPTADDMTALRAKLCSLEGLACSMVSDAVPPSLLPVIDATVAAVASGHPSAGVDTHGAMSCLRDLLWSEVPANSATGGEWLYRLLSAAADRRSPGALELPAGEEGPALLPSLPVQGGGKPKGLAHQTELSALLAEVLGPGCPGSGPARLFIRAVERLLHHIKRRLRPEVGYPAVPRDPDRCQAETKLCTCILATLELAVEWLLSAPSQARQPALIQSCHLLLSLLCIPAHLQVSVPQAEVNRSTERLDAACPAHLFLMGRTSIPHSLLRWVPLGLLVRLFDNLLLDRSQSRSAVHELAFRGLCRSDVGHGGVDWSFASAEGLWIGNLRSALLLLIIGRCSIQPPTLKMLGGEGWFHRLLNDDDSNVRYYSAVFLLKRLMCSQPVRYHQALHRLLLQAQQTDDHDLLKNPYLQIVAMLHSS